MKIFSELEKASNSDEGINNTNSREYRGMPE